jgi:hypothetical protein
MLVPDFWKWNLVFLSIAKPANISFKKLYHRFTQLAISFENMSKSSGPVHPIKANSEETIARAGATIGILERIFVVVFAATGQYTAFGMLMTAKSLACFERLTKEAAFAEYYLIGTLYSVLFAFLAYLIVFKIL